MYECATPASNERYFSAKVSGTTKSGCTNANITVGPTITPVPGHCSLVTINWSALPAAQTTAAAYRVYWRRTAPTLQAGYCIATVNGTSHTLTFSNNLTPGATYDFWYTVICTGGAMATSPITTYTACSGAAKPQGDDSNQADQVYEKDGIYYVNMPFNYLNIPVPQDMEVGKIYTVNLNEVNNTEYFDINRESATAASETGVMNLVPNPASTAVTVRYVLPTVSEKLTIRVMNINGVEVYSQQDSHPTQIGDRLLDLSELSNGVYMVTIQADGYTQTKKLVVAK
ncbi:MAG: T9SS C-terminal target domain-containing protein [Verrucomicrobia bacterium]|nr:T9SS C-terminal target domain-containing protein [Verrucomicrobiota bacterium]